MSKQNPIDIVARHAALDEMRKMRPEDIYKVDPEFVITYWVDSKSDDGTIQSTQVYETNWYYALFTATVFKIDNLFKAFEPKAVESKPTIILPETPKIII